MTRRYIIKAVLVLLSTVLMLSASFGLASAQVGQVNSDQINGQLAKDKQTKPEISQKQVDAVLNKSRDALTKDDLDLIVHIIFQEKTTYMRFKKHFDSLYKDQQDYIKQQFYLAAELYASNIENSPLPDNNDVPSQPTPDAIASCDPGAAPYCWRQYIEEDNAPTQSTKVGPRSYYTDLTSCDNDPGDIDYIFYFSYNSNNPDAIRFTASSSLRVGAALSFEGLPYGINSYGYNNSEVRFCVGNNGTSAAGGPSNIINNLKLYNR